MSSKSARSRTSASSTSEASSDGDGVVAASDAPALPDTYEAAIEELEHLVRHIESGQLPLDQLLGSYQRGAALLQFCRDRLQVVEQQVKILDDTSLKPWGAT